MEIGTDGIGGNWGEIGKLRKLGRDVFCQQSMVQPVAPNKRAAPARPRRMGDGERIGNSGETTNVAACEAEEVAP